MSNNSDDADIGLVAKAGLSELDLAEIANLAKQCQQYDGFAVKLNWEMLKGRKPNQISDFFYYLDGQLVGYAPLDSFGSKFELTGLVLPSYRRRGIFRKLFSAAQAAIHQRQAQELLLVSYGASAAGKAVAQALHAPYKISEYHMELDVTTTKVPPLPKVTLTLALVQEAELAELAQLLIVSFGEGGGPDEADLQRDLASLNSQYFLAKLGSTTIGQIGVLKEDQRRIYIRAVGILPAYRRQGYGRQLLAATLTKMLAAGFQHFALDVETANADALKLYQSCGFSETNVYEYYQAPF
jgi:ribosomal protein S18 acetylase RimI-like enzyme